MTVPRILLVDSAEGPGRTTATLVASLAARLSLLHVISGADAAASVIAGYAALGREVHLGRVFPHRRLANAVVRIRHEHRVAGFSSKPFCHVAHRWAKPERVWPDDDGRMRTGRRMNERCVARAIGRFDFDRLLDDALLCGDVSRGGSRQTGHGH